MGTLCLRSSSSGILLICIALSVRFYDEKLVPYWVYCLRINLERLEFQKVLLAGGSIPNFDDMDEWDYGQDSNSGLQRVSSLLSRAGSTAMAYLPFSKPVEVVDYSILSSGKIKKRSNKKSETESTTNVVETTTPKTDSVVSLLWATKTFSANKKKAQSFKNSRSVGVIEEGDNESNSSSSSSNSDSY